ncbi:c-type cytochrome [Sphingorhabdus sp. Alg239-R122]|uniref:c-type cytochrome n=1 Tax=Sphingorhabdus sp. Alg239-R122 TaxID=2305989 RepID=UPI0013DCF6DB|nr:c-type cytochrome [Sphingorhabdus sp. Alg239-R122]
MSDSNTIAGWVLGAGIAALGLSIVSGKYYHADKAGHLEKPGYAIAGVESGEGGDEGPALATLLASADAAAGEKQFSKCSSCHTINAGGAAGIGPNLNGVMGEAIATGRGGFDFSGALKDVGGTWTWEQMDAWIASPRKFANGTKMSFAGIGNAEDRANLLAYLNSQGSNLPLPEAPAEATEDTVEGEEAAAVEAAEDTTDAAEEPQMTE